MSSVNSSIQQDSLFPRLSLSLIVCFMCCGLCIGLFRCVLPVWLSVSERSNQMGFGTKGHKKIHLKLGRKTVVASLLLQHSSHCSEALSAGRTSPRSSQTSMKGRESKETSRSQLEGHKAQYSAPLCLCVDRGIRGLRPGHGSNNMGMLPCPMEKRRGIHKYNKIDERNKERVGEKERERLSSRSRRDQ